MDRKKKKAASPFSDGDRMLKKTELCKWLGVAPNTIESWVRDGHFPKPLVMGDPTRPTSAVRWRKWEIDEWINGRPREKTVEEEELEDDEYEEEEEEEEEEDDS
jgi:predicted DNA-binding transcriptional regulator AlpA